MEIVCLWQPQTSTMFLHCNLLILILSESVYALLFPANSVLQLTGTLSVPVTDLAPPRRLNFDWGFQMNHDLPSAVTQFYNIPIWPGILGNETRKRDLSNKMLKERGRHRNDFTAGELYRGLQNLLISHGFAASCLPRSICALAQHPFADKQRNFLTAILTFVLTPSLHLGFAVTEQNAREFYEQAELHGFLGDNCTNLYADCMQDLLHMITTVLLQND